MIRVYQKDEHGYKALEAVASKLNYLAVKNGENYHYKVEDIYFDLGAGIMWTTIVAYGKHEYQILYPRQHKQICNACDIAELDVIANALWDDRIR